MAAPKKVNYEAIEPGWRAGLKSPAQLAHEYSSSTGIKVSRSAIIKHFEKLGVPRDLAAKVRAKADAMVAEAMVTGKVSSETTATDAAIINAAAEESAIVRLAHRKDIRRVRGLLAEQMSEAEHLTRQPEVYAQARDALADPDTTLPVIVERMAEFVTSLPQRVRLTKDIADTLRIVIALEREALGMDDKQPPPADPSSFENLVDLASEALEKYRLQPPAAPAKPAKTKTPFGRPA